MATRTVPDAQRASDARFNQLRVERFRSDPALAQGHARSRNDKVVEVMCYLSLMRSAKRLGAGARVTFEAARRQFFRSPNGYEAAHYLPCQIRVNDAWPWTLIQNAQSRTALESLFAEVEHLPANFNKADTAAEMKGLTTAFQWSCQAVLDDHQTEAPSRINRRLVRFAYVHVWCRHAATAFRAAMAQKDSRPHLPPLQKDADGNLLNLEQRSAPDDAEWNIEEQINILGHYVRALQASPVALQDYRMDQLEREFKP